MGLKLRGSWFYSGLERKKMQPLELERRVGFGHTTKRKRIPSRKVQGTRPRGCWEELSFLGKERMGRVIVDRMLGGPEEGLYCHDWAS